MAFSQTAITSVRLRRAGPDLVVSWTSTAPGGTTYQLYVAGRLTWWGTALSARIPAPSVAASVEVGTVGAGEDRTDFSGSLPALPANHVRLGWTGGGSVATTVAGFRVYGSAVAGGAVDLTKVLATIPAHTTDPIAPSYSWTSGPLGAGVWSFQVVPFDTAGNACSSPGTVSATITAPPQPPAADGRGVRLSYTFNAGTRVATLSWLPSPG
jgi:hypothetical protein